MAVIGQIRLGGAQVDWGSLRRPLYSPVRPQGVAGIIATGAMPRPRARSFTSSGSGGNPDPVSCPTAHVPTTANTRKDTATPLTANMPA